MAVLDVGAVSSRSQTLDPGQVTDVSGRGVGGRGLALGGGGLGVLGVVAYLLLFALLSGGGSLGGSSARSTSSPSGRGNAPAPGVLGVPHRRRANAREDCRIVGDVNSVQTLLGRRVPASGKQLHVRRHGLLHGRRRRRAAARATPQVGPFYCPPDELVYVDLGFFDELQSQFGAQGGRSRRRT